jgi:hypothetical protein
VQPQLLERLLNSKKTKTPESLDRIHHFVPTASETLIGFVIQIGTAFIFSVGQRLTLDKATCNINF